MINVKEYIENEIYYLENSGLESDKQDIKYLENLTDDNIKEIQKLVEDDGELQADIDNLINEAINWWVYHYIEKKKENE